MRIFLKTQGRLNPGRFEHARGKNAEVPKTRKRDRPAPASEVSEVLYKI